MQVNCQKKVNGKEGNIREKKRKRWYQRRSKGGKKGK